ncbi:FtsX-like permease family protein [Kitasatospora sp. NPDC002040]|uniref:ABC transporter permease n=1 Tax=Kitasatospora sp. NPDC002040 TaxID=3154661 RepID=UPI0033179940
MSPIGRVVRSGVGRRRVQTVVIAVAVMMAVASAVVAGALLVAADAPFDQAFARQRGAHLAVQYEPALVSDQQLAATGRSAGVTASGGPYRTVAARGRDEADRLTPTLTLAGRSGPDGEVDRLDLRAGRWAERPGEVVLAASFAGPAFRLGGTLRFDGVDQALTVVGLALSAGRSADTWVTPDQLTALVSAERPVTVQWLYRFQDAGTKEQLAAARERLAAAVPPGALLGAQSYLDTKRAADQGAAPTVPFLVAFGLLGLAMSVIIVSGVVSGAVGTGLRRIGILKAIGFTPGEVVRAYVAQALIPAGAGIALGVLLGNLLALPLLSDTEEAYGAVSLTVAWWVDLLVPAAALLVVGLAALVPALRAGRLRTVEAIAVGRSPRTGRGQWAHRALGRLPLPRAVTYGPATPFAHPVRALAMLLAVVFGTVTATFAVGLTGSLSAVTRAQDRDGLAPVIVFSGQVRGLGTPAPGQRTGSAAAAQPDRVRAAVEADPGTAGYYGWAIAEATVAGLTGTSQVVLYQGKSSSGAPELIDGRWLEGPGEVAVPTRYLERTGSRIGDTVRVTDEGGTRSLRIVGEVFDTSNDGTRLHADLADFPKAGPVAFKVTLKSGVRPAEYAERIAAVIRPIGGEAIADTPDQGGGLVLVLQGMAALLTLMLVAVAGLGVLNSVVLDTRERVRDLGICKSLGMTPGQTVGLVLASVAGLGLVGGLLGVPAGYALHGFVLPVMGHSAGTDLPPSVLEVYQAPQLALLVAAGAAIALLGALLPAVWAARAPAATALRAE